MADFSDSPNNRTLSEIWAWCDEHDLVMLREGAVRMKPAGAEVLYALAFLDRDTCERAFDDRVTRDFGDKNKIIGMEDL